MPQTNHGSIEWLRVPNPEYLEDNTKPKLMKKWLRDSWSRRKIVALQQKFAVVTGTFAASSAWSSYCAFPSGFTNTNCVMLSIEVSNGNDWRIGEGGYNTAFARTFALMDANGIKATTGNSALFSKTFRVALMRTDI